MNIYLIHSVKGGCGKTSIALSLAAQLAAGTAGLEHQKVCLLDMDFKGTGLEDLLFWGTAQKPKSQLDGLKTGVRYVQSEDYFFWNECFTNPERTFGEKCITRITAKEFITSIDSTSNDSMQNTTKIEKRYTLNSPFNIDVIISSNKQSRKEQFVKRGNSTDGSTVSVDLFRCTFEEVVKWLQDEKYQSLVIDLPPSFDEYANAVYDCFFDVRNKEKLDKYAVYLLYVSTLDISHLTATGRCVHNLLYQSRTRYKLSNPPSIILNDPTGIFKLFTERKLIDYIAEGTGSGSTAETFPNNIRYYFDFLDSIDEFGRSAHSNSDLIRSVREHLSAINDLVSKYNQKESSVTYGFFGYDEGLDRFSHPLAASNNTITTILDYAYKAEDPYDEYTAKKCCITIWINADHDTNNKTAENGEA